LSILRARTSPADARGPARGGGYDSSTNTDFACVSSGLARRDYAYMDNGFGCYGEVR
jgi:hypothetical protein